MPWTWGAGRFGWNRADVLAFYNTYGGILFFGIANNAYSFCGTKTAFDSKLFNDKVRRYCGDKFFVHYCKAFLEPSGRYLGVAIVPKRGLQVVPFFADAPIDNGKHYFKAGDIAIRRGDETLILRGESATEYLSQLRIPNSNAQFLVNESRAFLEVLEYAGKLTIIVRARS